MFLLYFIFCYFTFINTPSCSFKYFENSDVIVAKKKSLLKFNSFCYSYILIRVKKKIKWQHSTWMYKLRKQEFQCINISYNNNVIITILRHIGNPGRVGLVYTGIFQTYSRTFSNIQPCSDILRDHKIY